MCKPGQSPVRSGAVCPVRSGAVCFVQCSPSRPVRSRLSGPVQHYGPLVRSNMTDRDEQFDKKLRLAQCGPDRSRDRYGWTFAKSKNKSLPGQISQTSVAAQNWREDWTRWWFGPFSHGSTFSLKSLAGIWHKNGHFV